MIMADQHPLDMWYSFSSQDNTTIPFCRSTGADCRKWFVSNMIEGPDNESLSVRLVCISHVSVPGYYADAAANYSSDRVTTDRHGNMQFVSPVCSCDPQYSLTGDSCTPDAFGYVILFGFIMVFLWVFGLFVKACMLGQKRRLGSRKKKALVALAALQYISQMVWMFGFLDVYFVIGSRELMSGLQNVGFALASLFMFMFVCLMVSHTCDHILTQTQDADATLKRRLTLMQKIFGTLPFLVAVVSWALAANRTESALYVIMIFQTFISAIVVLAFSFTMNVLTKRVNRMLPRDVLHQEYTQPHLVRRMFGTLACPRHGSGVKPGEIDFDKSSADLLRASKRLRRMSAALRFGVIWTMSMGAAFILVGRLAKYDGRYRLLSFVIYLAWQCVMSALPMVGVGALSKMKPNKLFSHLTNRIGNRVDTANDRTKKAGSVESSVGTLTS